MEEGFSENRDIAMKECCEIDIQRKAGNARKCKEEECNELLAEAKRFTCQGECRCTFKSKAFESEVIEFDWNATRASIAGKLKKLNE